MEKTIKLTTEQAKELYKQNPNFRGTILSEFTDVELGISREVENWEDLEVISGCYISAGFSTQFVFNVKAISKNKNVFATEKQAKSALAMAQLSQLMKALGDECEVDWGNGNQPKYIILRTNNRIKSGAFYDTYKFLAFKTKEARDRFLQNHEKLIKEYFMID